MPPTRLKPLALVNHSCAGFDDIPFRVVGGEDKNTFDLINSPGGDMPVCQFHGAKAHSERMSLGAVKLAYGHITARRIDEIESILIFATYHSKRNVIESSARMINKSKWFKSGWRHSYMIQNAGSRTPLPRDVH